jgi:hypothetical protein
MQNVGEERNQSEPTKNFERNNFGKPINNLSSSRVFTLLNEPWGAEDPRLPFLWFLRLPSPCPLRNNKNNKSINNFPLPIELQVCSSPSPPSFSLSLSLCSILIFFGLSLPIVVRYFEKNHEILILDVLRRFVLVDDVCDLIAGYVSLFGLFSSPTSSPPRSGSRSRSSLNPLLGYPSLFASHLLLSFFASHPLSPLLFGFFR